MSLESEIKSNFKIFTLFTIHNFEKERRGLFSVRSSITLPFDIFFL